MSFLRRSMSNIGKVRKGQRGFTIIEFIIVIALMAILTGVLVPMFFTSTDGAEQAKRKAGAESISKALRMYMNDKGPFLFDATGAPTAFVGVSDLVSSGLIPNFEFDVLPPYVIYYGDAAPDVTTVVLAEDTSEILLESVTHTTFTWDNDASTGIFSDPGRTKVKSGTQFFVGVLTRNPSTPTAASDYISILAIDN